MKRRWLCALLALVLCVGLLPMTALAASEEPAAAEPAGEAEVAAEEAVEEPAEDEAGESESAASEELAVEAVALANMEAETPALDGDTAEYKAVTGDAVIEDGVVTIYGSFTKPATEAAYGCLLRYSTDLKDHYSSYGTPYTKALSSEVVSWTMDWESYAEILPGVTYYYYAVMEDAEDQNVAVGNVKSFVGPTNDVKTIQIGQTKTVAAGTTAYYSFTPTSDGVYTLDYDGAGGVRVYVSTGDVVTLDYLAEEEVGIYAGLASFVATAGQTYYIEALSQGSTSLSFALNKDAALTDFKAVTGNAKIEGSSVTLSGTFTKPSTMSMCTAQIYVALSESELDSIETVSTTGYICDGVDSWSNKSGSAVVSAWSLLIPGVKYYYCAVITGYDYAGETVVARGEVKSFVAPERDFEVLVEDQAKTIPADHSEHYCSFTPANDGTYDLCITDGEGMVFVYDSSGKQITVGNRSQDYEYNYETDEYEMVYYENPATFTAEAEKTYYVAAFCGNGSMSLLATNTAPAHTWDSGVVTTEPTCTEKGVKTFTCSDCGETKTEDIAALGHTWNSGEVTTDPGCTTKGVKTYTCSDCGETKTEDIAALGHSWGEGVVTHEPTCTEKGEESYACSVCGGTKTEDIAMLDHSWDEGVVTREPTVKEEGEKTFTCSGCSGTKTEEIARLTVAEALEEIDPEAAPEEIRDTVQEIGEETLSEAMTGKDSAEVIEQIKELEEKVDGSFTVVVTEAAAEAGVSDQVTVVGARLNDLTADGAEIVLTIDAAKEALTLPSGLSDENAVYLEITLTGVDNASALKVPVYLTLALPETMDAQKVRLVHYGVSGTEVLLPVQLVEGEDGVWYASFVVSGFSPFALAEVVETNTSTGGSATSGAKAHSPKTGDESNLVLWASILLVACGAAVVVVNRKKEN